MSFPTSPLALIRSPRLSTQREYRLPERSFVSVELFDGVNTDVDTTVFDVWQRILSRGQCDWFVDED